MKHFRINEDKLKKTLKESFKEILQDDSIDLTGMTDRDFITIAGMVINFKESGVDLDINGIMNELKRRSIIHVREMMIAEGLAEYEEV